MADDLISVSIEQPYNGAIPGRRVQVYGSQETLCGLFGMTGRNFWILTVPLSDAQALSLERIGCPACVVLYHQEPES